MIMLSGGHKARPYISKGNSPPSFRMKIRGFRSGTDCAYGAKRKNLTAAVAYPVFIANKA